MQIAIRRNDRSRANDDALLVTWRGLAPTLALAAAATLAIAVFALAIGTVRISPATTVAVLFDHLPFMASDRFTPTEDAIIWQVRLPRVVLAGLVGATLGVSGAAYQAVFRNPLAEPYLMGVAAGASVGATLIIVSPLFVTAGVLSPLPPAAFVGASAASRYRRWVHRSSRT
jgi:iron complex transport system permease protein